MNADEQQLWQLYYQFDSMFSDVCALSIKGVPGLLSAHYLSLPSQLRETQRQMDDLRRKISKIRLELPALCVWGASSFDSFLPSPRM